MKLKTEYREIVSNTEGITIPFRMSANNPVLFDILRKQIYSQPILSVCREIICNGIDAHREKGNTNIPLKIQLPGNYIVFEDFGIGISQQRMDEVYSVYGESTKRNSNEYVGCYGLGCKSPFATCDSYIVISTHGGIKRTFNCFIDESGKGSVKLVAQYKTTEVSGTTVKIPVNPDQRHEWVAAVKKYSQFLEPQPVLLSDRFENVLSPLNVVMQGDKWRLYDRNVDGANVIVDGIPYLISKYNYGISDIPDRVAFFFPTGVLEPTATREEIRQTPEGKKAVQLAAQDYRNEVLKLAQTNVEKATDIENALAMVNSLPNSVLGDLPKKWKFFGGEFVYPMESASYVYHIEIGGRGYRKINNTYHLYKTKTFKPDKKNVILWDTTKQTKKSYLSESQDLTPYDKQRLRQYKTDNNLDKLYLIEDRHLPLFPGVVHTKMSSVKLKINRVKSSITHVKVKRINMWDVSEIPIDSQYPVIYFIANKDWYCVTCYNYWNLIPVSVVKIKPRSARHVKNNPNWMTIDEYLKKIVWDKYTIKDVCEFNRRIDANRQYEHLLFLKDHVKNVNGFAQEINLTSEEESVMQFLGANNPSLKGGEVPLYKQYPLLAGLDNYWIEENRQSVIDYVKLVNKKDKTK